jgi:DNA-binding transcriptional ArsR family regulator
MTHELPAVMDVAELPVVLTAIADPVRLEMLRRLAEHPGESLSCSELYDDISKSTASHHFKILREAGLTSRSYVNGCTHQQLRLQEVEERHPGVLSSVLVASGVGLKS